MLYIYVLKLQHGKYYVGKTTNPQFRLEIHSAGNGSEWTRIHKPVKLLELVPDCDDYDEDKYTRIYMDKYGIDNVRGGSFVYVQLDKTTRYGLAKMSNSTNNRCFKCGRDGHFAKDCYINKGYVENSDDNDNDSDDSDVSKEYEEIWCCSKCNKEFAEEVTCAYHEQYCNKKINKCFRCGREGHYASSCYANRHIKGYYLE